MLSGIRLSARIAPNVSSTGYNSCGTGAACCFLQGDRVRSGATRWRHVAQTDPVRWNHSWKYNMYNLLGSERKRNISPVYLYLSTVQYSADPLLQCGTTYLLISSKEDSTNTTTMSTSLLCSYQPIRSIPRSQYNRQSVNMIYVSSND